MLTRASSSIIRTKPFIQQRILLRFCVGAKDNAASLLVGLLIPPLDCNKLVNCV